MLFKTRKSVIWILLLLCTVIAFRWCFIFFFTKATQFKIGLTSRLTDEEIDDAIENYSHKEVFDYFSWSNASSCTFAHVFGGKMIGGDNFVGYDGQKSVCLDEKVAPDPKKCLVYSFGINDEWSFDKAMMKYGCVVYAFDPSMSYQNHTRWKHVHFYRMGLDSRNYEGFKNWSEVPMRNLKTIYDWLKTNHGEVMIDYLKVDVDYAEWDALPEIIASGMMDKVRQMTVEVHMYTNDDLTKLREKAKVLRQVEKYGLVRFNSEPNMFSFSPFSELNDTKWIPGGYEIAFYNSKLLRPSDEF